MSWQELYPFESSFAQVDGHRYHYVDQGAGAPLLFVHGNPTWSFFWRELIQAFSSEHRCIAVDHVGMGLSDKPQNYPYHLEQHIDNLAAFIEQLNLQNITLVVHDWGGPIGLGAAAKVPDRMARLVLMNTAAFPPPYVPSSIRLVHLPWAGEFLVRGLNLFCRRATTSTTCRPQGLSKSVRAGYLAPYDSWHNRVAVYRFVMDIPRNPSHPSTPTIEWLERQMAQFRDLPTQIVWGDQDWCFRLECLQRLQQMWPQARVTRLPNASHYLLEDEPERVIDCLRQFFAQSAEEHQPAEVATRHD